MKTKEMTYKAAIMFLEKIERTLCAEFDSDIEAECAALAKAREALAFQSLQEKAP